ncbi:hypothetical protein [Tropicimonas sp. IMCC34043]|uniref:hypothetical protein n=1 Tax=Tropicimonas sp. IMCC34043 TaxID=2248760 RepID=UPI000E245DDF|nr:hypothetical protein [Tropicimonas sp. IMCC34043]
MATLGKLLLILFVAMTGVYIGLSIHSRRLRRDKLEREWDEEIRHGDRARFIDEGMEAYHHSLRRKLILGVYVIPFVLIGGIIYLTNYH